MGASLSELQPVPTKYGGGGGGGEGNREERVYRKNGGNRVKVSRGNREPLVKCGH